MVVELESGELKTTQPLERVCAHACRRKCEREGGGRESYGRTTRNLPTLM